MHSTFQTLSSLLFLSLFSATYAALHSSGVIFPLYIYPTSNCSNWLPLINSIISYPKVPFYVIINPNSGPGSGTQPDTNYQTCTAQVKSAAGSNGNVKLLGYVSTSYGSRAASAVTADVNTYSGWTASYRLNGIFFDEAATSSALVSTYSGYASTVRSTFGTSSVVVLNPGTTPTTNYFTFSDLIVTSETYYSQFTISSLTISSSSPASKQAVILHTAPSTLPTSLIDQLIALGIKASFITNYGVDQAYSNVPSYWSGFVARVDSSQN
ncbi:Spherulation-specific family 4 [Cyathus striatus]|nr:Spherulation-specific family 4 [Cyathus striatus]